MGWAQSARPSSAKELFNAPGAPPALGLRYSILLYGADDSAREVDAATDFRSGERIRIRLQANDSGHLYVVLKGSSGNWRVLFPSKEFGEGNNTVERGQVYDIPGRSRFIFDEQAGVERLFLVLSRQPEASLERLIYKLEEGSSAPAGEKTISEQTAVPDQMVERLRSQVRARDLVFEKVDQSAAAAPSRPKPGSEELRPAAAGGMEKAIYVVNPSRAADARLVVDLNLKHH
jgi:hypothetical protein